MSQLIQIRQQIKTVDTIQRITNAMRLISRSSHSRLNKQKGACHAYYQSVATIFESIEALYPTWKKKLHQNQASSPELIILVGSNKGLCGNFNNSLFNFFSRYIKNKPPHTLTVIPLGKKTVEFLHVNYPSIAISSVYDYTINQLDGIAEQITDALYAEGKKYSQVNLISNKTKNFFVHYTELKQLMPLLPTANTAITASIANQDIIIEELDKILDTVSTLFTHASIQTALFESCLAEQAARFVSMDSSTKNAEGLLEKTKLRYNKLRQAKITKDLIEIASSF